MSSGKSIYAHSVGTIYDPKPEVFLQKLSIALAYNINVCFFDSTSDKEINDTLYIENGFNEALVVNVDIDRIFDENYFIVVPINHVEKEFWITFYPNGIISIFHIPFTNGWSFFVESILDKSGYYFGGWDNYKKGMENVRELYMPIFKKLKCNKVFLSTDANYNWENELVFEGTYNQKISFEDILNCAVDKDNLKIFSLKSVFQGKFHSEIQKLYQEKEYFKIAFLDDF